MPDIPNKTRTTRTHPKLEASASNLTQQRWVRTDGSTIIYRAPVVSSKKVGLGWVPGGSSHTLLRRYDWIPFLGIYRYPRCGPRSVPDLDLPKLGRTRCCLLSFMKHLQVRQNHGWKMLEDPGMYQQRWVRTRTFDYPIHRYSWCSGS